MSKSKKNQAVWVGIDWGHGVHAVAIVSSGAEAVEDFSIPNTPAGYAQLEKRLAQYGIQGIAVESTRHTLLLHLAEQGHRVYLINPKQSKDWRKADTVSGAKSDARDGLSLARGLAFRHRELKPMTPGDPAMERLALLCEKECGLIHRRTALVQELTSCLKLYYPAALEFFADWTAPAAWDFLLRFPTADMLCRSREHTLIAFLKGHHLGESACWKDKVEKRGKAGDWPVHPQQECYEMLARGLVGQLKALQAALKEFRAKIEAAFAALPEAGLLQSLPGAGDKLAPRLMAIVASPLAQHGGIEAVRGHSGVAPVTKQSGKRRLVCIRFMCNKHWRNTLHLFAWCSTRASAWAQAFYKARKAKGDTHSTALRKLADKWLRIIMKMLETNQRYDEQKYLNALKRNQSPTWRYLKENACG